MTPTRVQGPSRHGQNDAYGHGSRRGYIVGFFLSLVLTAIPFWLVMSGAVRPVYTALLIFAFAFVQIIIHVRYFLHLDTRAEGGWTLMAFVFTVVIVAITIAGSIWIMYHLDTNMMPMSPGAVAGRCSWRASALPLLRLGLWRRWAFLRSPAGRSNGDRGSSI